MRNASGVMATAARSLAPGGAAEPVEERAVHAEALADMTEDRFDLLRRVDSLPAATGVWVVKTVVLRTAASASSDRLPAAGSMGKRSKDASAACPSLRCTTDGAMPSAASARMPPTPSTPYCASRV